ncbi:MAG: MFS transporter [Hyphomicrobiales bacterium]
MTITRMPRRPASAHRDDRVASRAEAHVGARHPILRTSLIYVALFSGSGLNQPYLPAWLVARGLGASDIALVLSLPMLLRLVAAPLFGALADRSGDSRVIVRIMAICVLALALALSSARGLLPILLLATGMMVMSQSIGPIVDASVLSLIRRGIARDFGRIRLWGSASFAAMTVLGGFILEWGGPDAVFGTFILATASLAAASFLLPAAAPASRGVARGKAALLDRKLLCVVFLVAALVLASHATFNSFGTVYMRELGYPAGVIGLQWALATSAEIMMFWAGPAVGRILGPFGLLALAAGAATLRWSLMSLHPGIILTAMLQILHAATFSGSYLGLMLFVQAAVEDEVGARAQSAFATLLGLLTAATTMATGPLYARFGAGAFQAAAALPAVALLFLLVFREKLRAMPRDAVRSRKAKEAQS